MKQTSRSLYAKIAAIALLALSFGLCAYGQEAAREELAHAYYLLKTANADYGGHRANALHEVQVASHELGVELRGAVPEGERQWASDRQMAEARRLLGDLRDHMAEQDRTRISQHLNTSIREIDLALRKR